MDHFRSPLIRSNDPQAQFWDPTAAYEHLVTAFKHDPYTCACFSKGFQMLHGVMAEEAAKGAKFAPQIYAHRIPSYFGMLAATFIKKWVDCTSLEMSLTHRIQHEQL